MATNNITNKNTLKGWFKRGLKPLETQFHAWMDSYWHKTEMIPTSRIDNLETILNKKAENSEIEQLLEKKVDQEQGKELMPSPSPVPGTNTVLHEDGTWKTVDYNEAFPELPENADKTYYLSPLLTWEKLPDSVIVLDLSEGADNSKNCNVIVDKFARNSDVSLSIALRIDKISFAKVAYVSSTKREMKLFAYFMTESNGKHILNTYIFTMQINISAGYVSHSVEQEQTIIPAETIIEVVSEYPADLSSYPDGSIFIKQQV